MTPSDIDTLEAQANRVRLIVYHTRLEDGRNGDSITKQRLVALRNTAGDIVAETSRQLKAMERQSCNERN